MPFDDYFPTELGRAIEKVTILVPVAAAVIAMLFLWSHSVDLMLGFRSGVGIALVLFAPTFAFFRTESIRFSIAVLSALVIISWPSSWFEALDQLATSSYTQFALAVRGLPWWDTTVFKASVEAVSATVLSVCLWPYRYTIGSLCNSMCKSASRSLTRLFGCD